MNRRDRRAQLQRKRCDLCHERLAGSEGFEVVMIGDPGSPVPAEILFVHVGCGEMLREEAGVQQVGDTTAEPDGSAGRLWLRPEE